MIKTTIEERMNAKEAAAIISFTCPCGVLNITDVESLGSSTGLHSGIEKVFARCKVCGQVVRLVGR